VTAFCEKMADCTRLKSLELDVCQSDSRSLPIIVAQHPTKALSARDGPAGPAHVWLWGD
jgi:hypothetical protein